ncbi:MAG: S9 family peptidase [Bacteroidales bacterium]|nr:S9 family peptidase [Bacteroidales bacterium]
MKNLKKVILLGLVLSISNSIFSQKKFTLENTVWGGNDINREDFSSFCGYFEHKTGNFISDEYTKSKKDEINSILQKENKPTYTFVSSWYDINSVFVYSNQNATLYCVDLNTKTVTDSIKDIYADFEFSPDNKHVAYSSEGNLYVSNYKGTHKINIRKENGIVYGTSVHRNEFGIDKGIFWSPSGKKMAFYKMDEKMVAEYPKVDITQRIAKEKPFRYPMAGEKSHEVSIGVYETNTQKVKYLITESPVNRYFTNICWTPDEENILVAEINREQNHLWFNVYKSWLNSYNQDTIVTKKTLFEETNNEWVEPCIPPMFVDNDNFVWISERDGFRHIYLYNIKNGKCKQLTKGNYCVTELYGTNNGEIFFQSNKKGYLYKDIYKVNTSGKITCLTSELGVHNAQFNKQCTQFIDNFSSPDMALKCTLKTSNGKEIKVLKEIKNPFSDFEMPEIRLVNLKSADGKFDLSGRLILPIGFDSTKVYPVIDYLYGGPHNQLVDGSWLYGASLWKLYFAQKGYIVFSMDNRGTENRGAEFEHIIHRNLGKYETEDQKVGLDYLKSLSFVDKSRIGIHGWSYGGFMTINMLTTYPGEFKAGIAGGPVCDWKYYEVMYGERYMDTPQSNPKGYENSAVINKIGNLKDRLLVIHGDIDNVVVWQNSLMLLRKAIDADVQIDYAVYPQHEHNVLGHDRVHLFKKIEQYFDDFLLK